MGEDRMPKLMLSGWLPQHYPQGGPWRRWRDVPRCDLKAIAMSDENWYDAALSSDVLYVYGFEGGLTWMVCNKSGTERGVIVS